MSSSPRDRSRPLFLFSAGLVALSLLFVIVMTAVQIYVRWNVNQNFTFLGGNELEAITVGAFALLIALVCTHRHSSDS